MYRQNGRFLLMSVLHCRSLRPDASRYASLFGGIFGGTGANCDIRLAGMPPMSLTDAKVRSLRPREKSFRAADARGLYVEISPGGSKLWRFKYRIAAKETRIALGAYPEVSLQEARRRCTEARLLLEHERDPALELWIGVQRGTSCYYGLSV